jgi:hypothetical protein
MVTFAGMSVGAAGPGRAALLGWSQVVDSIMPQAAGGPGNEPPLPPWNVEGASIGDQFLWQVLNNDAVPYFSLKGWPHPALALKHYLDNTGTDFQVDPSELQRDVPGFQRDIDTFVNNHAGAGSFDSGWINTNTDITDANGNVTGQQSLDWYYTLHDWRYRVTGTSTLVNGQPHTDYTVEIYKPYVFGSPRSDINIPIVTPVTGSKLDQDDIQHLNAAGIARNFTVRGSRTYSK